MSIHYYLYDNDDVATDVTQRVQQMYADNPGTDGIVMNAEEGTVGTWNVIIEDADGDFDVTGHRKFIAIEDEATATYGGVLGYGFTEIQEVGRGPGQRVADARRWSVTVTDINTIFERRIFVGADCKRPAETDVARLTWALATAECILITDDLYFSTANPVDMDAVDYTGQSVRDVFDDCAQQSGNNWFLWWTGTDVSFFYDETAATAFAATIKISNVLADINNTTVFEPAFESSLKRDPTRVYSGVYVAFDGGYAYTQRAATYEEFAQRDTFSPNQNVKTVAKARARGQRYLRDIATQEETITTSIFVPRLYANSVIAGQRIQVKYSHFPGYESYVWMRVLNRTVRELGLDTLELGLELVGDEPAPAGPAVYGILRLAKAGTQYGGGGGGAVWWAQPGDTQPPGYPHQPTTGLISATQDLVNTPFGSGWSYSGWQITGTGTVDVTCFISVVGVQMDTRPYTIIYSILLNGVAVETTTVVKQLASGFSFMQSSATLTTTALAVVPGDDITASVTCSPGMPFFRAPAGTGQSGERLEITGGSLA